LIFYWFLIRIYDLFDAHPNWKSELKCSLLVDLFTSIPNVKEQVTTYLKRFSHEAAKKNDKNALFIDAAQQFPDIEKYSKASKQIRRFLDKEHLQEVCEIVKKDVKFKDMLGRTYVLEVPVAQEKYVPSDWVKINQTKAMLRYHTPTVLEKIKLIQYNEDKLAVVCNQAWNEMLAFISQEFTAFRKIVNQLAVLDVLYSFASVTKESNYVKPIIIDDSSTRRRELNIKDGRHPIIESLLVDTPYVPNSIELKEEGTHCISIFGPNMGGKSSFMKQVALISIMAQIGCYVPARACRLSPFDGIYTRMGARDNMSGGESTFMVELGEASEILRRSTARSLIIMDELGRGTSSWDGANLAYATLKYIAESLQSFCLFVTHYPLIAKLEDILPTKIANFHMAFMAHEEEQKQDKASTGETITFLYKLIRGYSKKSYGLNVAKLAGLPDSLLQTAREKSQEYEDFTRSKVQLMSYARLYELLTQFKENDADSIANLTKELKEMITHLDM